MLLRSDPRSTNKAIAQNLGFAESTIAQRIRTMSDLNIMRVIAQREIFSDDFQLMCLVEIGVTGNVDQIAKQLINLPEVTSVSRCLGRPQLLANVRSKNRQHLDEVLRQKIGLLKNVSGTMSHVCLRIIKLEAGFGDLNNSLPDAAYDLGDDRDSQILKLLIEDGRVSSREIARRLEVSAGSVQQRLKRMYDSNQMKLGVVVDPSAIGDAAIAIIRLRLQPRNSDDALDYLKASPSTSFVGTMTGDYGIWTIVQAASALELSELLEQFQGELPGPLDMIITPLVNTYLHRYDLVRIR